MITNLQEKFLTDKKGHRIAVVLDISVYEKILEDLDEFYCEKAYEQAVQETDLEIEIGDYLTLEEFIKQREK
ncbi:MAG: hypothetical protein VKJ02_18380 [Snowella sp.]|nr:hypothetical protein [Snowella sp.]